METKNQLHYLPDELIIQIMLRLPVKSLIRFKCVCKFWFSIISSDTHFANSQFELTAATHTQRALLVAKFKYPETRSIDLELSIDDDDSVSASRNPPYFLAPPNSSFVIKGSCRGFILFYCFRTPYFYLWNPTTGLHKQIPLSFNLDKAKEIFCGFGYDQSTDDYLVVSMLSDTNSSYWEFFSLRANMWKQIDEGTHIHYANATNDHFIAGSLFNGAIHWFVYRRDLKKYVIVGFDLMERKLLEMDLPDQFDHKLCNRNLFVFREFLSIWARNSDNRTLEIWVMKEYRVHSSWTKTHVLPTHAIFRMCPLSSTKSSDIVAKDGRSGFVKYNDEGQLLWHHSYFNQPYGCEVVMYTESSTVQLHKIDDLLVSC